jgi:cation-transporting ATPase E
VTLEEERTVATIVLLLVGLWVLVLLARPFTILRALLVAAMIGLFVLAMTWPFAREFYELELPPESILWETFIIAGVAIVCLEVGWQLRNKTAKWSKRIMTRFRANPAA